MKHYNIALLGDGLFTWDGGVDYLSNIACILEYIDKNWNDVSINIYLVLPKEAFLFRKLRKLFDHGKFADRIEKTVDVFESVNKDVKIVFYKKPIKKIYDDKGKSLERKLKELKCDICFPILRAYYPKFSIPWIAYIPDLQEKYLPSLFPQSELDIRDSLRRAQVDNSRFFIATSQTVKNDIEKFYPSTDTVIYAEPFAPVAANEFIDTSNVDISSYNLPSCYFVISNQFWAHKSHDTAIKALKKLHDMGYSDVYLLITGKMDSDSRNDSYSNQIRNLVLELRLDNYVRFLGFIPKLDQIEIIKRSNALIQPSLFEGDPGGCSVYNANSLGVPAIMTDIPVNLEAKDDPLISIFKAKDFDSLAEAMVPYISVKNNVDCDWIRNNCEEKSKILADFYMDMINDVISKY